MLNANAKGSSLSRPTYWFSSRSFVVIVMVLQYYTTNTYKFEPNWLRSDGTRRHCNLLIATEWWIELLRNVLQRSLVSALSNAEKTKRLQNPLQSESSKSRKRQRRKYAAEPIESMCLGAWTPQARTPTHPCARISIPTRKPSAQRKPVSGPRGSFSIRERKA